MIRERTGRGPGEDRERIREKTGRGSREDRERIPGEDGDGGRERKTRGRPPPWVVVSVGVEEWVYVCTGMHMRNSLVSP